MLLATMATVTSGLLSPNSYGLNPDQVTVKMSTGDNVGDYERYHHHHHHHHHPHHHHHHHHQPDDEIFNNNSSESEQEESSTSTRFIVRQKNDFEPKRNKRKNFKPRCSIYSDNELIALNLSELNSNNNNNNNNNSVNNNRRRKTLSTRKLIQIDTNFTPIDLSSSKNNFVNNNSSDNSNSDFDNDNNDDDEDEEEEEEFRENDDDGGGGGGGGGRGHDEDDEEKEEIEGDENEMKIPSSFSIHNLSKPHISSTNTSTITTTSTSTIDFGGLTTQGQQQQQQVSDMREYAMNTMRELLGIYGLTSEVAESISRQLPIAAFNSGKMFENLSLNTSKLEDSSSPPSQPPTPPSTPLSPKSSNNDFKYTSNFSNIPPTLKQIYNTNNSSPNNIPQNYTQKIPLNLGKKQQSKTTNGSQPTSDLYYTNVELEAIKNKLNEDRILELQQQKNYEKQQSTRGIFPSNLLPFTTSQLIKTDSISPPPLLLPPPPTYEQNPLNAMMAQSLAPTQSSRDSTNLLSTTKSMSGSGSSSTGGTTTTQLDYSKYVKKFSSALECGSTYCKDLNYREHFHCLICISRMFIKKEEMIRHFKWHKKRDESLQHGFMRYSPLDDCNDRYTNCQHNKKQTHYHCIKDGCDKVYISTSDVQMHANFHRKDKAIMEEGFQRYRATEECGASYCAFFGQRTTHFHCRRSGCRFTFKNKSDMEKHKTYHIKDEQLARDGFKKFMKNESCPYERCRFSRVCNHIHCIRPQCNYVLHSSGQLFSHKRKHERKDSELAYRKYKLAQSMIKSLNDNNSSVSATNNPSTTTTTLPSTSSFHELEGLNLSVFNQTLNTTTTTRTGSVSNLSNTESLSEERNSPISYYEENDTCSISAIDLTANDSSNYQQQQQSNFLFDDLNWNNEEFWRKYCQFFNQQSDCCSNDDNNKCELNFTDHYHCMVENCEMIFNSKDGVREHARNHEQQELVTENYFTTIIGGGCDDNCIYQDKEKHYHCNWDNCREVILPLDKPFRRLEHYKMHEYSKKLSLTKDPLTMTHLATSIDGMFCRKRGRPPKNRVIEVWNDYSPIGSQNLMDSPQAIFTSFKLPKPSSSSTTTPSNSKEIEQNDSNDDRSSTHSPIQLNDYNLQGFDIYTENTKCFDNLCPYLGTTHYHCNQNRCLYVTDKEDVLIMHSKDFHDNIDILDGFEFYDRNIDCRLLNCPSNKINRHFHCTRRNCNYSFVQYSTMAIHNQIHLNDSSEQQQQDDKIILNDELVPFNNNKQILDEKNDVNLTNNNNNNNNSGNERQLSQFKAINLSQNNLIEENNKISVVKASGTFFPLSTLPTERNKSPDNKNFITESNDESSTNNTSSNTLYGPDLSCSRPFCKLKRKYHYHCNACNQAFSEMDRLVVHVAKHSTGALNSQLQQTTEEQSRLSSPPPSSSSSLSSVKNEPKINVAPLQSLQNPSSSIIIKTEHDNNNPFLTTTTNNFDAYQQFQNFQGNLAQQFALITQQNAFLPQNLYQNAQLMFQHHSQLMQNTLLQQQSAQNSYNNENLTSPLVAMAANLNKRSLSPHLDISPEQKKARIQNSMRILKDEPVPEGYLRFRFNEDCQYQHCGYREHQTHFHCQRIDCGYSFCDKTRFVQHTARHERLDTLMGGDFQQYRANVSCGRQDCAYTSNLGSTQNKASHFHCLKCEFVCTDTNKVVAHRRQHQKLDSIQAAGFEKFTPSQQCRIQNCQHSGKQTHYHCLSCQYAVLGLAQMSAHKYRHMEG